MKEQLEHFLQQELKIEADKKRFLLAVSGGLDSMVLVRSFLDLNLHIGIAHCNFGLRGEESDGDEEFVKQCAKAFNRPFYSNSFDTTTYAENHGVSIQMAARQLRYTWLEQVRKGNAYDYIVVAHHQDDAVETFFINLLRGTGLSGLSGIPAKNGHVIRPFLSCSRAQLAEFANANGVHYRNDSSNASDYYVRNKLRLNLLPELRKINPALNHTIVEEMSHFSEINAAFGEVVKQTWNALIEVGENNTVILPKAKLERLQHLQVYLFYFLQPYGFNKSTVNDILIGFQKTEEAEYFSVTHRLVRQRTEFVLEPIQPVALSPTYSIHKRTAEMSAPFPMTVQHSLKKDLTINKAATYAYFDATTLTYPLELRKWKKGDAFYPFGMRGRKKLSDFFTDLKMSGVEKESTWVLTSGGEIIWVVGHRIDRRFALKEVTTNVVVFRLIQRK